MKLLATYSNMVECDMLRILLESNGIQYKIENEYDALANGGMPAFGVPFQSWGPQIWVDDADFDKASRLMGTL